MALADIKAGCSNSIVGGVESKGYFFLRSELVVTKTNNLITDLSLGTGKKGYYIDNPKKMLNGTSNSVHADDAVTKWTNGITCQMSEIDAAAMLALKELGCADIIVILERKEKPNDGDGTFVAFGVEGGLQMSACVLDLQTAAAKITFSSLAANEEKEPVFVVLDTNYATTKALLEGLMSVQ